MKKGILLLLLLFIVLSSCDLFIEKDDKSNRLYKSELIENTMAPASVGFYVLYFYSDENELISTVDYNSEDVLLTRRDYEYTSDRQIRSYTQYNDDGVTELSRNEYYYNLNGDVSIITKYYRGQFSEKYEYLYDDRIISQKNIYEEEGSEFPDDIIIPTYDDQNLLVKLEYYSVNSNGTMSDIERYKEFIYEEGQLILINDVDSYSISWNETTSFSYNSDNKIIKIKIVDDNTVDETTIEYGNNEKVKSFLEVIDTTIGDEKLSYSMAGKYYYEKGESLYSALSIEKYIDF